MLNSNISFQCDQSIKSLTLHPFLTMSFSLDKAGKNKTILSSIVYTNLQPTVLTKSSLVIELPANGWNVQSAAPSILKTPEELQRKFICEKHGGAHGETTDGVDWCSTEENLHAREQSFKESLVFLWIQDHCLSFLSVLISLFSLWPLTFEQQLTRHLWSTRNPTHGWYSFRSNSVPDI